MRRLNVFLSSAMTGELDRERDGLRILFQNDPTLKEFFDLYVIEAHASPQPIQKAYADEVRNSDILILLLDKQLRDAVKKEFSEAQQANLKIFVYSRNRKDKRDEELDSFIGKEAYKFHSGSFYEAIDLCSKVRDDIKADLMRKYTTKIDIQQESQDYIVVSSIKEYFGSSLHYYDYDFVTRASQDGAFKDMDIDQLVVLATLREEEFGNLKEALLIYEIILLRDPYNWQAYNNRGLILSKMGNADDAFFSYMKAIELNSKSHATLYNIGKYYDDRHLYEKAIEYYLKALEIKPDKTSALGHLVKIYILKHEYQKALEYADRAYSFEKNEMNLSNLCMTLGLIGMKEEALIKTAELKGTKFYQKVRAHIFCASKEWIKCLDEIETFLELWNFDYDLSIRKIHCLIYTDNIEKAITWIKHLEKNHYLSPSDYNNIAWILYEKKLELKYSADLLRKSVKGDPAMLAAWKNLQCVLGDLMEAEEGLVVSNQALKYYPDDPGLIMNRAKFLFMSGNIRECTSYMMKELSRVFGGNISVSEIEELMNQSFMNAGIKDLESFEKIFKAMSQIEKSKIRK